VATAVDSLRPADLGAATVVLPPRPKPSARPVSGSLQVQCTPWCVLFVDGQRRGDDGRLHTLTLPGGPHKIVAQRLDDHKERSVEVSERAPVSISFQFE
jgi:hypothetical protein